VKFLKNLSNAVPTKARWVFVGSFVIMAGILVMVWRSMSGDAKPPANVQTSAVIETTVSKIPKARPDEVTAAPDTSPMVKQLQKSQEAQIQNAETGKSSYVGGLSFQKAADVDTNVKKDSAASQDNNIDDIMKRRNQDLARKNGQNGKQQQQVGPILNEDEYLKGVIAETAVNPDKMMQLAQTVRDDDKGFLAQVNYEKVKNADGTDATDGDNSYYSSFLPKTDKSKTAKSKSGGRSFEEQVSDVSKVQTKTLNRGLRSYGVLNIGVNTDEISPTTATIIENGDLMGAEFIAEQPVRAGEKAVITFKSMALNGKDYNVRAIALDPATQRTAIADDVNRHILERYLSLGIAAFVSGYADTLQDSTTTVSSEGSTTNQKSAITDAGTQTKVAIGKVGEKFSPAFEEGFKRPPTVTVDGNREIVVMLLDPIDIIKN
jgi:hypothetical protein